MIFLLHAEEDEGIAEIIAEKLPFDKVSPWVENNNYPPVDERGEAMKVEIKKASYVVLVFSHNSFSKRGNLLNEYEYVLNIVHNECPRKRCLIPIRIDDCILPPRVQDFHFYNLFEEGGIAQLERVMTYESEKAAEKIESDQDSPTGQCLFYKNNWEWIIKYEGEELIGNHKYDDGFTYLHFILNTRQKSVSIDDLKNVTTRLYQPERYELLGLDEDWEEIERDRHGNKKKNEEQIHEDIELFKKIRDVIIFAIQSIKNKKIHNYFLNSIKFFSDQYVFVEAPILEEDKKVEWKLYLGD